MGATKIMVIRHAEKPGSYDGVNYFGVDGLGSVSGAAGAKHLVTLGWERAGALVGCLHRPMGRRRLSWRRRNSLFASDPAAKSDDDPNAGDEGPSQRPYETLTALATKLGLNIDKRIARSTTPKW